MFECGVCGNTYNNSEDIQLCDCGEPLRLKYFEGKSGKKDSVWDRYENLLPSQGMNTEITGLGEGDTPLSRATKLSDQLDIDLYLKNETVNPTWSFKDRGTITGIKRAFDLGKQKIGTVSTGNMAASVAAYGARNEIETVVLVSSEVSDRKIGQIDAYDPRIIRIQGDYGELYYETLKLKRDDIYFTNSNSPFRIEGYKTIAFEIFEDIMPDYVMIPTSSGGLFRGIMKGFIELKKSGITKDIPTPVSVQAEGCSPIHRAYDSGREKIKNWPDPETLAKAISNPYPPGGNLVLKLLRKYDGVCEVVSDEEIRSAQKAMAREGIFCQPSAAVGTAALAKLRKDEKIEEDSTVVSIITGSGLKSDTQIDDGVAYSTCNLEELDNHL